MSDTKKTMSFEEALLYQRPAMYSNEHDMHLKKPVYLS